jgi:hypothetical protein
LYRTHPIGKGAVLSAHFCQIQAKAPTQTMTSSQGCTVTPPSMEGSSGGGREGQSLYQEEVKGKETTLEYLAVLLQQEGTLYPPCEDYLSDFDAVSSSSESDPVSESWRRKLCEWCFEVVDHFKVRKLAFGVGLATIKVHENPVSIIGAGKSAPLVLNGRSTHRLLLLLCSLTAKQSPLP